ncbi:MAG: CHAT domain-containing protein [Cyanobacteria bacterium]|jgi:hypothetical protein|nr:CHAT domain-containing protein [Cyanobacteria bacterium GSL.Bin21]
MSGSVVMINLGSGNLNDGCPEITAQVIPNQTNGSPVTQVRGSLPADQKLAELYRQWQLLYREYYQENARAIKIDSGGITHFSELEFRDLCAQLKVRFNHWLNNASFAPIDRRLCRYLSPDQEIQIVITTDDPELRRLPWQLWNLLADYPYAEVVLSHLEYYRSHVPPATAKGKVRVLAVFGDAEGIDLQRDRAEIEMLPGAESTFLEQPNHSQLNESLWDQQGWDILFFAGHSYTEGNQGHLRLNGNDTLTLESFHQTLKTAVSKGLKLAIFNSCDGLGLSHTLGDLGLCAIVMREAIPNPVAEEFFRQFLIAFAGGKSLHLAIREARERLEKLEHRYPCASWLPVLCQQPTGIFAHWQDWQGNQRAWQRFFCNRSLRETAFLGGVLGALGTQAFLQLHPLELLMFFSLWKQTQGKKSGDDSLMVVSYETGEDDNAIQQLLEEKTLNLDLIQQLAAQTTDFSQSTETLESGSYQIQVEIVTPDNGAIAYSFAGIVDLTRPTVTAITLARDRIAIEFSEPINPDSFGVEDITLLDSKTTPLETSQLSLAAINDQVFTLENFGEETPLEAGLQLIIDTEGVRDRAGNSGNLEVSHEIPPNRTNAPLLPNSVPSEDPVDTQDLPSSTVINPDLSPTSPSVDEIQSSVIIGTIEITVETLPDNHTSPVPDVESINTHDSIPPYSESRLFASFTLESDDFHFSIDTYLIASPPTLEESLALPESVSEATLRANYETVIIEERNFSLLGDHEGVANPPETYDLTLFDEFTVDESDLASAVADQFEGLGVTLTDAEEAEALPPRNLETALNLTVMTRIAFNDELAQELSDLDPLMMQMDRNLILAKADLEADLLQGTLETTGISAMGEFLSNVSSVGVETFA